MTRACCLGCWLNFTSLAFHATNGGPSRGGSFWILNGRRKCLLHHFSGQIFVLNAIKNTWNGANRGRLFIHGQFGNAGLQRTARLFNAVECQQNLKGVTVGFFRFGQAGLPALGGLQCGFARARLKCQIGGPLEQGFVFCFACSIQQDGKAGCRFTILHAEFAQQELVKQNGVEVGVLHRRLGANTRGGPD